MTKEEENFEYQTCKAFEHILWGVRNYAYILNDEKTFKSADDLADGFCTRVRRSLCNKPLEEESPVDKHPFLPILLWVLDSLVALEDKRKKEKNYELRE